MLSRLRPTSLIRLTRGYATANNPFFNSQAYINGRWLDSDSHQVFPVINPSTNEIIGEVADCDEQDSSLATQAAVKSFKAWSETSGKQRAKLLRQLAEAQMANINELAEIITSESGKPIKESMGEIAYGASFLEWFADLARTSQGEILSSPTPDKTMMFIRQAAGPVGIITPWNFPNAMITRKLGAALAAGCTSVIKPAPNTPYSALAIAKLIDGLDIPEGVVNVLPSSQQNSSKIGFQLCKAPEIRVISFTGSSAVGKLLIQQSASTVKRVCLELGGNAPFIVFNSANLDKAVDGYIASKFRNTGQTCVSANRCFVQSDVYEKFVECLKTRMGETLKAGDTMSEKTTVGSLISKEGVAKVESHVKDALDKGGKLILGGKSPKENHFEPTLITDARPDMLCCREETFGPLAAIVKFTSEEEVLEQCNSVRHGLAGYFYSQDLNQIRRVCRSLEVGMIGVNEGIISSCEAPFGGVKESGLGREGSHLGLEEYQELNLVTMDLLNKALDLIDKAEIDGSGDLDCISDDEDKGSKFQNENVYNKLLPYDVTAESQEHLMRIKAHIAKCIQLDQETVYEWLIDLDTYVGLYGLAFTKDDHIYFVRLLYELMVAKDSMDLYYIGLVAQCFSRLMRKRCLITSDELQLDWRPLYETYERLLFSETEALGLRFVPENLEPHIGLAIKLARPHFAPTATKEMLEEWRPMLCPFSVSIQRAVTYLNLFLSTTLPPEEHHLGFKLWFDEIMQLWLNSKNCATYYESKLTLLLARLSSDCLGYIDWEPYIPRIFNHFKASLNLNGTGSSRCQVRRTGDIDIGPCVQWMVYMISGENSCLDHISKLFKAIESFYHPSNADRRWHTKLQQFLFKLPACYVKRLYRERFKNNVWSRRVPEPYKLTEDQTSRFVDALLPVVLTSMFNQSGIGSAALAFRDLSVLRPEKVVPPLLDRLYGSYETLTEPHRLLASINCMASVVPAMIRPCESFPEGPSHVVPLLLHSLPGIDSNDMRKCIAVFRFVATIAAHVRIRDYSYLVDERPDLTYEQQQLCLSTAQFEDFVIQFLDKCFILIENTSTSTLSTLDQEPNFRSGEEGIIEAAISSVFLSILAQASPRIQQAALDKIYSYVTRHIFDTKTRGKAIATLCLACAKSCPKEALSKFVPHFGRLILTLTDNDEVFQESILDEELLFSLLLMSEIVRCNSSYLLEYKELIVKVLERSLKLTAKEGYMLGCGILRHLLRGSTNIACSDWSNIDYDDENNRANEARWPFDNWSHTTHIKDLKLKWDIPGPESRKFALDLMETFMRNAVKDLMNWCDGRLQLGREQVQRSLHIILSSIFGAASVLPSLISTVINLCPLEVSVTPMLVKNTGTDPLNFSDGTNVRTWVVEAMRKVLKHLMMNREDDTKSLTLVCEVLALAISYYGQNKTELKIAAQRIKSMKSGAQNKMLGSKRHLRYLLVERVVQQHRAMLLNKGQPEFTELHLEVFKSLFELAQSHYVDVRVLAQDTVTMMLNYWPFMEVRILLPPLVQELQKPSIEHNKFKGLLHMVIGRRSSTSILVNPNWTILEKLWPAIVKSPHSEKPSIVRLLDRICSVVQKGFDTFELRYGFSEKVKSVAAEIWNSNSIDPNLYQPPDEKLKALVQKKVAERNEARVRDYEQLVLKLVELIDDPQLHWHRRIVAHNLFTHLMRDDHPLPLPALNTCLLNLISERLSIRTKAVQLVAAQLKLHKRKHLKRMWCYKDELQKKDSSKNETDSLSLESTKTIDCNNLRNSNKWMQYKLEDGSYSKEEWDKLIFVDKPHVGFYDWPKHLEVYEPYEKQPKLDRTIEELNEYELLVYKRFTDTEFVEKLVNYFCFEDNKGSPESRRFDTKRPGLFKGLFRNYGPCMIEPFRKYVHEYANSTCEHKQKFVIEFLAGLIRGSKHWSYEMVQDIEKFVLPIMEQMAVNQENFNDWTGLSNYVFRHRDVKRIGWLLKYLLNKAVSPVESSSPVITPFMQSCRLTLAQYALIQCEWRAVDHIFPYVVENLKPQDHLLAYANVRAHLASIYSLIYMYDDSSVLCRIPGTLENGPKRIDFINSLLPRLALLEKSRQHHATVPEELGSPSVGGHSKAHFPGEPGAADPVTTDPIGAIPMDAETSVDDTDMALIAETLMKFRPMGSHPDSPQSNAHKLAHTHRDGTTSEAKVVKKEKPASTDDSTSFVDSLRRTLPNLDVSGSASAVGSSASNSSEDSEERKDAIKLMKLTAHWMIYNVCRIKSPVPPDFFKLLPLVCEMGRESNEPDLASESLAAVAILGSSTLSPEAIEESLACVRKIIAEHSWHARVAVAFFIELMISSNLFLLLSSEKWRKDIEDIVINYLISDERIEVRESSSLTLSGMIHCEFTKLTPELIDNFKKRASEQIVKRKQQNGTIVIDSKSTVARHSGILCLCACVDAYPYSVPDYLPGILTFLSDHLTDPQPISTTIKKTMSNFRRTHHDNWQSDKTKFTDDQLCVLADLLVSPSYYA